MKVGIRFSDNDFSMPIKAFMDMFILPTFIDRGEGHMVTHLTSSMIVELFNTHASYVSRYLHWQLTKWADPDLYNNELYSDWLTITEQAVYWDDNTDQYLNPEGWDKGNNSEFIWTDGKKVYIS